MRDWGRNRLGATVLAGGLALAGGSLSPLNAQSQQAVPDAQVESNVLKALASAPELSTQNIQSSTVYGTVTLTGNVHDETMRVKAENLAARADGVKKVVDELALGDTPAQPADQAQAQNQPNGQDAVPPPGQVLQSDGTYAPANAVDQTAQAQGQPQPQMQGEPGPPMEAQGNPGYPQGQPNPNGYGYPNQAPPPPRRPMYQNYGPNGPNGPQGGQVAGVDVTVPPGAVLRIRINRGIDSQHIKPGTPFDGVVMQDVVAGGAIAIPRGASVSGTVVDAKRAGALSGHGELSLQLSSLTLGGVVYPLNTEVWERDGKDKTAGTVNSALGLGVLGAIVGGVAGGGSGAAIGAGVGGAAGVAGSAASPRGQIIIPPESLLTFKTAAPVGVKTVSQQELGRLAYAAGPQQVQQGPPRRYYYPYGPYGPGYYPAPPPPPQY